MANETYWKQYDEVKALIVHTKPPTFEDLKKILNSFQAPSAGEAFWPGGDGTYLADELMAAGWSILVWFAEFHYIAESPTGEFIEYVEGDLYARPNYKRPTEN